MVEIRLDDDLYTYDGEFKNALIFVLASLTGNDESTLAPTYENTMAGQMKILSKRYWN